ncbi:hypothetical protein Ddc_14053 [Ditylenchus destructor]|nr:hypothetical protein Ddc_14053 [Ditylenchus destructor]
MTKFFVLTLVFLLASCLFAVDLPTMSPQLKDELVECLNKKGLKGGADPAKTVEALKECAAEIAGPLPTLDPELQAALEECLSKKNLKGGEGAKAYQAAKECLAEIYASR